MSQVTLYNYFRSSTSYRVRIALHFKGISFEYKPVPLLESAQHRPEYLALNPQGEVPTLIHDSKSIAQSLPILEYLDEVFPEPRIYPRDAYARAKVRQFCENINSYLHPLGNLKVLKHLETRYGASQADKEAWIAHWYAPGFTALEKMLQESAGDYCFGGEITAADFCLIPALFTAKRFNFSIDNYPIVRKIEKNCLEHPAFKKAHPMVQPDTPPA